MPNQNELNKLLQTAAERLGTDPQSLKQKAESGELSQLLSQLSPRDSQKMQQVLSDPQAANKLLSTPQAQALLKKFMN